MKKTILLVMCLFLFSYPAKAQDESNCNAPTGNVTQSNDNVQVTESPAEKTWDREYNRALNEEYGSAESPAFLNRENIDSDDSDYDDNEAGSE